MNYKSGTEEILKEYTGLNEEDNNLLGIFYLNEKIANYYINKYDLDSVYIRYADVSPNLKSFKSFLEKESKNHDKLFLGVNSAVPAVVIPMIKQYFPHLQEQNNYFAYTSLLFLKEGNRSGQRITKLDFESVGEEGWSGTDTACFTDSAAYSGHFSYLLRDQEWGPAFSVPLHDIISHRNNFIDVSLKVKSGFDYKGAKLVASLKEGDKNIYWKGNDFSSYLLSGTDADDWQTIYTSLKLSDIRIDDNDIELAVYIWNKNKKEFLIDDFTVEVRQGNPVIYALQGEF